MLSKINKPYLRVGYVCPSLHSDSGLHVVHTNLAVHEIRYKYHDTGNHTFLVLF
jgi:hypothetical protein